MDRAEIARRDRRIARAIHIVLQDLRVRHPRAFVARAVNVEPTYFSKLFRDVAGVGFQQWSMAVRVEAAQNLLCATDRQIREIAAAVGYADVTTFERAFRKLTGLCPREYRAGKSTNAPNAENLTLNAERSARNAD
jgi:two-component system, response regulator YesN